MSIKRKLRYGMVGGGIDSFIGAVHRMAAQLDGQIELVAGCLSSDPDKAKLSGETLFLSTQRIYASYQEMVRAYATGWYTEIVADLPPATAGRVAPLDGPGLGLSLKPDLFSRADATVQVSKL